MSEQDQPKAKPAEKPRGLSFLGWVFGGLFVLIGAMSLFIVPEAGGRLVGFAVGIIGVFSLPPVVRALRSKLAFMRPLGVPTIIGLVVGIASLIVFSPMVSEPADNTLSSDARESAMMPTADGVEARDASQQAVRIVGESDPMRPAQDALNRGEITTAVTSYFSSSVPQERRASPEGQRLRAAIQAAMDQGTGSSSSDRATKAFQSQLASLKALTTEAPDNVTDLWQRVDALSEVARVLQEHPPTSRSPDAISAGKELRQALVRRQNVDFPVLRKAYGAILGRAAWEQDIEVTVQGMGNKTIRFIGGTFAANRNVASAQSSAQPNVEKLRFGRTQYEWYRGSENQYYMLETPTDAAVGFWDSGRFVEVE